MCCRKMFKFEQLALLIFEGGSVHGDQGQNNAESDKSFEGVVACCLPDKTPEHEAQIGCQGRENKINRRRLWVEDKNTGRCGSRKQCKHERYRDSILSSACNVSVFLQPPLPFLPIPSKDL